MSSAPQTPPRTVQCYHCRRHFDVPGRAMSISCPWCYRRVTLDDLIVKDTCWTSKLQTCGKVHVQRKGVLVASLLEAREGVEILGTVEATIVSGGPVFIGPKARVKGDVTAPSLWVEKGAVIDGGHFKVAQPLDAPPAESPEPPRRAGVTGTIETRPTVVVPKWTPALRPG
jgi:cytoskeletal protein CcmA (bactofilin family)